MILKAWSGTWTWTFYDPEVHAITQKFAASVLDKSKVLRAGMALTIHEVSFDEEGKWLQNCFVRAEGCATLQRYFKLAKFGSAAELWLRQQYLM